MSASLSPSLTSLPAYSHTGTHQHFLVRLKINPQIQSRVQSIPHGIFFSSKQAPPFTSFISSLRFITTQLLYNNRYRISVWSTHVLNQFEWITTTCWGRYWYKTNRMGIKNLIYPMNNQLNGGAKERILKIRCLMVIFTPSLLIGCNSNSTTRHKYHTNDSVLKSLLVSSRILYSRLFHVLFFGLIQRTKKRKRGDPSKLNEVPFVVDSVAPLFEEVLHIVSDEVFIWNNGSSQEFYRLSHGF